MANPKDMNEVLCMDPMKLIAWCHDKYNDPLPTPANGTEFKEHNYLLSELAGQYAFISSCHAAATVMVRIAKRKKEAPEVIDAMLSRRDVLDTYVSILKMKYEAFSRMITVQKQAVDEMKMMGEAT